MLRPCLLSLLLAGAAGAQSVGVGVGRSAGTGTIAGTVKDSAGAAIPGVEVVVADARLYTRSDTLGAFRLTSVPVGAHLVRLRRFGFSPESATATVASGAVASIAIVLETNAYLIDGMTVEESTRRRRLLGDFYDRASRGFGHFITRDQIEARNPSALSDMFRMIPGTRIVPGRTGSTLRFARASMGPGRDCPPQFWVDGIKVWQLEVDDIPPQDVEGVEVYPGPSGLPPQFNTRDGTTACGVVVIWTRIPG